MVPPFCWLEGGSFMAIDNIDKLSAYECTLVKLALKKYVKTLRDDNPYKYDYLDIIKKLEN